MKDFVNWMNANPAVIGSIASAVIAASVALVVFALSQLLTLKRERNARLTPKLEELYTLLNEVAASNATWCRVSAFAALGDQDALQELKNADDLDLYGHRTAKKIIMYVRLYFPKLGPIHQRLFAAQRELSKLMFKLFTEEPPTDHEVMSAGGEVSHFIRLMEAEIIDNRDSLIGDKVLPKRYRPSTQKALEERAPRPDVPMWSN